MSVVAARREYRTWRSAALGRDMELLVFGERGTPVVVFPTSMGRFYQWEDFGLVGHLADRIDAGWLQLWCVDSVDAEALYDKTVAPEQRVQRHVAFEKYILDEVLKAVREANDTNYVMAAGSSFGAFHAAAIVTRHPGHFRKAVCLSGAYDASRWLDGRRDGDAYFVNPLAFLPGLTDEGILAPLRETEIVIATGADDPHVEESRQLALLLQEKSVPATLFVWPGWAHDWPFWKEMVSELL